MPREYRVYLLITHQVFIPFGARCCTRHIGTDDWDTVPLSRSAVDFEDQEQIISVLIDHIRKPTPLFNFEERNEENDRRMKRWTGYDFDELDEMTAMLGTNLSTLSAFLIKLRKHVSNEDLSDLFAISRTTIEHIYFTKKAATFGFREIPIPVKKKTPLEAASLCHLEWLYPRGFRTIPRSCE